MAPRRLDVVPAQEGEVWAHGFPLPPGAGLRGLRRQMRMLSRLANVVPLGMALEKLDAGDRLPPRTVAITFDDGYRDNLRHAAPLLRDLRLPATFFLVPGLLSRSVRAWWEILAWAFTCTDSTRLSWEGDILAVGTPTSSRASFRQVAGLLKGRDRVTREAAVTDLVGRLAPRGDPADDSMFLDWDQAGELVKRGFSVGSHSMYHAILSREGAAEQERDLAESRRQLQDRLGNAADLLAYPNGTATDYSQATIAAARSAGHSHALTTLEGRNSRTTPPYELRRYVLSPTTGQRPFSSLLRLGARRL